MSAGLMRKKSVWELGDALGVIRELQREARLLDFHVTLGGGVLNTGQSYKDLDLFVLPLNDTNPGLDEITALLTRWFGPLEPLRTLSLRGGFEQDPVAPGDDPGDYPLSDCVHYRSCLWGAWHGKRVDLFVL